MKRNKHRSKLITAGVVAIASVALFLSGCSNKITKNQATSVNKTENIVTKGSKSSAKNSTELDKSTYDKLADTKFENGTYGYVTVNNDKSTLDPKSWKTKHTNLVLDDYSTE